MNSRTGMAQLRRAVQLWLNTVEDEEMLQEVAAVAPSYQTGYAYKAGEVFAWGIYRVVQAHTSQAGWPPDQAASLYKAIGLTDTGIPIWAQPTGGHDAYNVGDRVSYNGTIYESLIDGNATVPGSDDRWWAKKS